MKTNSCLNKKFWINRLIEHYKTHKKLIVAVDFDDTIFDFHNRGEDFSSVINLVKRCQEFGFYIIIYTCSPPSRYPEIEKYCRSVGIIPDKINDNVISPHNGANPKDGCKLFFNILLDDRAGLKYSMDILRQVLNLIVVRLKVGGYTIDARGNRFWYNNKGLIHRDGDLPAAEYANGNKHWYKNGARHRDGDKPAIDNADGHKEWYQNGLLHRDGDKPAVEYASGRKFYYKHGVHYFPKTV